MAGLANFLAYVILYWFFWGEAVNGHIELHGDQLRYFLNPTEPVAKGVQVSRAVFIYSCIHSISIAPTVGAIMLAMLTLAKDRVVSAMRRTVVRGRTMITILAIVITVIVVLWALLFIRRFYNHFASPQIVAPGISARQPSSAQ